MSNIHKIIQTPVGRLTLVGSDSRLFAILWENDDPHRVKVSQGYASNDSPVLEETQRQLNEYFAGTRHKFELPIQFDGTEFQQIVWRALLKIGYGETVTYGDIARRLGNENAVRAVGAAVGKNPISIVAPCHRVVGSTGKLTGFAGGLENKAKLLDLESTRALAIKLR